MFYKENVCGPSVNSPDIRKDGQLFIRLSPLFRQLWISAASDVTTGLQSREISLLRSRPAELGLTEEMLVWLAIIRPLTRWADGR